MPEIEQYEPISAYSSDVDNPTMEPARDGGWVKHEDALTALQQQRKQVIAEVEEALRGMDRSYGALADHLFAKFKGGTDV